MEWLAAKFPQPDAPSTVRKLPQRQISASALSGGVETAALVEVMTPETASPKQAAKADASSSLPADADSTEPDPAIGRREEPPARSNTASLARPIDCGRIEPLAAERYRVQSTGSSELTRKLELAADVMAHRNPSRDFAPIVERALDLLIAELEKERFGKTSRPRPGRTANPDRVTRETQRAVLERDGLRCAYVDEHGRRCTGRAFLERDHKNPRGKGGGPNVENVRHLCRQHNQWLAEVEYGRQHMDRARSLKRWRNTIGRSATSRTSPTDVGTTPAEVSEARRTIRSLWRSRRLMSPNSSTRETTHDEAHVPGRPPSRKRDADPAGSFATIRTTKTFEPARLETRSTVTGCLDESKSSRRGFERPARYRQRTARR